MQISVAKLFQNKTKKDGIVTTAAIPSFAFVQDCCKYYCDKQQNVRNNCFMIDGLNGSYLPSVASGVYLSEAPLFVF